MEGNKPRYFRGLHAVLNVLYYQHSNTAAPHMLHPDDQTDDIEVLHIEVLRDNLQRLRKTVEEQRMELEEARTLVASMKEQVEKEAELRQSWIDVFEMQLDDDGSWKFNPNQNELWQKHEDLLSDYEALIAKWNKFVPRVQRRRTTPVPVKARGRPLGATDDQIDLARQLRDEGRSYRQIVDRTGLSLQTVRTIITGPEKAKEARQKLVRHILNNEAAARYRARKRQRDAIPARIGEVEKKSAELISAARRF